jgi:hypothetical protein
MTDLMEAMNGDHITARKMIEVAIGPMEIAKTAPVMTIVREDMAIVREDIIITVREAGITTTVREDTITTVRFLMGTTVLLMGIIIITVHTEIMIANTIVPARKDIATGLSGLIRPLQPVMECREKA